MFDHNEVAGAGEVFVCACCGRRSKDRAGRMRISSHWDESCVFHAVRVYEASVVLENGLVIAADAVRPN
jgi:hypothetical protein